MERRILVVASGFELGSLVSEGLAHLDPAVLVDHAHSLAAAVSRLAAGGYDLIVADTELDGARSGLFLRHLCERRFPAIPFLLAATDDDAKDEAGGATLRRPLSVLECRERIARLL